MREVRAVKPDFLIGLMPGMGNWYTNGVARGMAAPGMPVLITGEGEYFIGYNPHSRENQEKLRKWGFPAFYLPGLTISSYNAEGLGAKAAEAALRADGYWLYYGEMFFVRNPRIIREGINPSEYALREPAERYLAAMKKANAYLAARTAPLKAPEKFAPLPSFASPEFAVTAGGITFRDPKAVPGNLLSAGNRYVKNVSTSPEGGVIFSMGKQGSNQTSWSVPVEAGKRYVMTLKARASGISIPVAGFRVQEGGKIILSRLFDCDADGEWTILRGTFTPKTDKVTAVILAYGETGSFEFKDARLVRAVPLNVVSAPLAGDAEAVRLGIGENVYAELVNPVTKLAYFRLIDGENDLRYLREIYGISSGTIRFSGDAAGNISFGK